MGARPPSLGEIKPLVSEKALEILAQAHSRFEGLNPPKPGLNLLELQRQGRKALAPQGMNLSFGEECFYGIDGI
jgi:hypothetical protein